MTDDMVDIIARLRATSATVDMVYKEGTHTCGIGNVGDCSAPIYESIAQSQIRQQALERADIYLDLPSVLNKQILALNDQLKECLLTGMFADLVSSINICTVAIYGNYNFSCKAVSREFEISRESSGTDYSCLEKIVNLVNVATQITS